MQSEHGPETTETISEVGAVLERLEPLEPPRRRPKQSCAFKDIKPQLQFDVIREGSPSMKFPYDPSINAEKGLTHSCFVSIESMLNQNENQKSADWSIFKVPRSLRNLKPDAYTPQLVSIGPVHRKKDSPLQIMERHKLGYMQCLLNRTQNPKATLSQCNEAVLKLEQKARSCYADTALDDDDHKSIAETLLVDGCFIIELLLKFCESCNNDWMVAAFQRDLILLENQIPFSVLDALFQIIYVHLINTRNFDPRTWVNVAKLAFDFFYSAMPLNRNSFGRHIARDIKEAKFRHLLDLVHKCLEPEKRPTGLYAGYYKQPPDEDECLMRTLGELVDSGVEIKRVKIKRDATEESGCVLVGIKFEDSGTLVIPELCVSDTTEVLLRNLVAYEQYSSPGWRYVTSYVLLMDRLIDSERDVQVLEKARVLNNSLGHLGRVADLFNDLCVGVVTTPEDKFMFSEVCVKVDNYCSKWLPKNMAILRRQYFPNIWKIVAFLIAFLLLALTVLQSIYAVLSYDQ